MSMVLYRFPVPFHSLFCMYGVLELCFSQTVYGRVKKNMKTGQQFLKWMRIIVGREKKK